MRLLYREAEGLRRERRADLITDVNAGFNGGSRANDLVRELRKDLDG